jgi:FK506-binding nuclear protein
MARFLTVSAYYSHTTRCNLTTAVSANKKGKPFAFKIGAGEVIKGWDIGVQGMSVGGERRISIPAKLAYGSKAQPGIPANSELLFDLKMISIN